VARFATVHRNSSGSLVRNSKVSTDMNPFSPRLCAILFVFSCSVVSAADEPNVLFIAADEMYCDLGDYGHRTGEDAES